MVLRKRCVREWTEGKAGQGRCLFIRGLDGTGPGAFFLQGSWGDGRFTRRIGPLGAHVFSIGGF